MPKIDVELVIKQDAGLIRKITAELTVLIIPQYPVVIVTQSAGNRSFTGRGQILEEAVVEWLQNVIADKYDQSGMPF